MVGAVAYALSCGLDFDEMVRLSTAASAAAVAEAGTGSPHLEKINELKPMVSIVEVAL
jgi:fructose-1-phosphate kinase PfkB-like protein